MLSVSYFRTGFQAQEKKKKNDVEHVDSMLENNGQYICVVVCLVSQYVTEKWIMKVRMAYIDQ